MSRDSNPAERADYRARNHASILDSERRSRAKRIEDHRTYNRQWSKENDRTEYNRQWAEQNRELLNAASKRWRKRHPDKVRANSMKRKAAKLQRIPPWADLTAIAAVYREASLKTAQTGEAYEVDHIYPLRGKTVSGLHVVENLQIIPARDNRRKSNLMRERTGQRAGGGDSEDSRGAGGGSETPASAAHTPSGVPLAAG